VKQTICTVYGKQKISCAGIIDHNFVSATSYGVSSCIIVFTMNRVIHQGEKMFACIHRVLEQEGCSSLEMIYSSINKPMQLALASMYRIEQRYYSP